MADGIFCCPCASIKPLGFIRSTDQLQLWEFAWLSASYPRRVLTACASSLQPRFQCSLLRKAAFCIQLERWVDGDKCAERYFIRHPCRDRNAYVEVEREPVVTEGFVGNWEHIKLRCGCVGQSVFFVLKFLSATTREMGSVAAVRAETRVDVSKDCQAAGRDGATTRPGRAGERKRKRAPDEEEREVPGYEELDGDSATNVKRIYGKK